jgi:hypothetical protein
MVNNQLLPRMIRHGFPLQGIHFDWDYSVDYTPEQQKAYEEMVLNNFEVDGAYFQEKYNMPVGERRASQYAATQSQPQEENGKKNAKPFFD